jgi:hypothetical protein
MPSLREALRADRKNAGFDKTKFIQHIIFTTVTCKKKNIKFANNGNLAWGGGGGGEDLGDLDKMLKDMET